MKKMQSVLGTAVFCGMLVFGAIGCISEPAQAKGKVHLSKKEMSVTVGKKKTMKLYAAKKVKWTAKGNQISIKKITGNKIALRGKRVGKTTLKAKYKGKVYSCKITVTSSGGQSKNSNTDNQKNISTQTNATDSGNKSETEKEIITLNKDSVDLYALATSYSAQYTLRQGHNSQYKFLVNGTSKKIRWSIAGATADKDVSSYLTITSNGTVTALKAPTLYSEVKAIVTAKVGGQKLQATVTLHNEADYCLEDIYENFRSTYLTDEMSEYEQMEKIAWYLSSFFTYDVSNYDGVSYLLLGCGDCLASREAVMLMCRYFGIKSCACYNLNYHGETLVQADGKLYIVTTGYNEPLPRTYNIREVTSKAVLDKVCADNSIRADYFDVVPE